MKIEGWEPSSIFQIPNDTRLLIFNTFVGNGDVNAVADFVPGPGPLSYIGEVSSRLYIGCEYR